MDEYGWRPVKDYLHPVYIEGNMSAEFLRDLVCSCKGKSQCKKSFVCAEQNLACTDFSKNTTSCMQQNASTEYKSATNKAKQLYKAF
jgi:hypothetical protein